MPSCITNVHALRTPRVFEHSLQNQLTSDDGQESILARARGTESSAQQEALVTLDRFADLDLDDTPGTATSRVARAFYGTAVSSIDNQGTSYRDIHLLTRGKEESYK